MKLQLFQHESVTKNRSIQNEYYHPTYTLLSKTAAPNQSELLYQRIQKMKRQLSNVSSELVRLDPENITEQLYLEAQKKGQARRPLFQLLQSETNQIECNKKLKIGQKTIKPFGNYTLNVPIQMVCDDQSHDDGIHGVTGEMMDRNFDRILDLNCGLDDDILEIQSKFAIVRSQKRLKEPQYEQPDHKQQHIYSNTHQKLLEQQNQYIRDQLVLFTTRLEADKGRVEEYRKRYRNLKKENHKMKAQLQYLRKQLTILSKSYEGRQSQYNFLYERHQLLLQEFDKLGKQYHFIQNRLEQIYKQNVMYQQRLQDYENHRDREIESLQEEKNKVKEALQEEIVEKQKEIQELNQYIYQIKNKNQSMEKEMAKLFPQRNSQEQIKLEQESKIFDEGANSICLSLAQAETLKNIIQQQQESHKNQIQNVRRESITIQKDLKDQIAKLHVQIEQLNNKNQSMQRQRIKQKQIFFFTQSPSKNPQFSHSTDTEDWKGQISHQLLRINFTKQIKRLQGYLLDQREQKSRLMDRISKLQQHNILIQNEQDDQLQQLLQNCVNELEKQKEINNYLKSQNEYYKQMIYRQQMPIKGRENQILN